MRRFTPTLPAPFRIGNYSKGLPHDQFGEVTQPAYDSLLTAVGSGAPADFEAIELGGDVKLVNPQAGLAFDLLGADSHALSIPPSPAVASAERAAEMVELYWMALCRDVPFSMYGKEPLTNAAIADLNNLPAFTGPKIAGKVTEQTLFRGDTPGELKGPVCVTVFSAECAVRRPGSQRSDGKPSTAVLRISAWA
jgi:hypothetical protein